MGELKSCGNTPIETMTEGLVHTAECLNEIRVIVDQITEKLRGPEPAGDNCEKGPWPPHIGIGKWIIANQANAEAIRRRLVEILEAM